MELEFKSGYTTTALRIIFPDGLWNPKKSVDRAEILLKAKSELEAS
jgi:hypothetical protein